MLGDLFKKYGTDKGIWGYTPHYEAELEAKRHEVKRVLEIGICGNRDIPNNVTGASLFAWQDYFPNAQIVGLDNEKAWMVNVGRITSHCINAYDRNDMTRLMQHLGADVFPFDFICDDAVHDPVPQIDLAKTLWPYLAKDGLYAIEDVGPYKLPLGNMNHMIVELPDFKEANVCKTHKPEVLLLIKPLATLL